MKKWILTRYLKVKQINEKRSQKALATVKLKERWFAERIVSLREEREKNEQLLLESREVGVHDRLKEYLEELEEAERVLLQEIATLKKTGEEKRELVEKARKERKIIENIWQNRYTAWRKERFRQHNE